MLPDLVMRTTLIVGYPGETEAQFENLLRFVESEEFDHVGVFTYSPEDGTRAALLGDRVPDSIAHERRNRIMEAQHAISLRKNKALIGSTQQVLIEGTGDMEDETGATEPVAVGRARRHAPEVDGLVFVPGVHRVGEMVDVHIDDAGPYDLWASMPGPGRERRQLRRTDRRPAIRRRNRPVPMATRSGT
jgi:ribosomal protein S12 methylthiotransferase